MRRKEHVGVIGAGPHGHQLAAILRARGYEVKVFDDFLPGWPRWTNQDCPAFVIGAAWPSVRRRIRNNHTDRAWHCGSIYFPGVQFGTDTSVGWHTHIEYNAVVSHGCKVGSFVTICPGAVLAGEVTVQDDVFIGANATVIHGGITIGKGAIIGAGTVVLRDVPPGKVVKGVW